MDVIWVIGAMIVFSSVTAVKLNVTSKLALAKVHQRRVPLVMRVRD